MVSLVRRYYASRATLSSGFYLASGTANVLGGRVAGTLGPVTFLAWSGVAGAAAGCLLWVRPSPVQS